MRKKHNHTGYAIVLAWPETLCKQAGAWYDGIMSALRFSKNNYYKVGHNAIILVETETGECYYFDFGRYHSPFQYGRVRDAETDHDLEIKTKAIIGRDGKIANYSEIISEIFLNPSCHGSGALNASYCAINFEKASRQAKKMQGRSLIPYGPFKIGGTNCSRFVKKVTLSGKPQLKYRLLLHNPKTVSPMPLGNVKALDNYLGMSSETATVEMYTPKHLTSIQQLYEYQELT